MKVGYGTKLGTKLAWWEGICLGWNHPTLGRFQLLGRFQEKYCFFYSKWADSCPLGRFQPRQIFTQLVLISRVPDSTSWFQLFSPSSIEKKRVKCQESAMSPSSDIRKLALISQKGRKSFWEERRFKPSPEVEDGENFWDREEKFGRPLSNSGGGHISFVVFTGIYPSEKWGIFPILMWNLRASLDAETSTEFFRRIHRRHLQSSGMGFLTVHFVQSIIT